MDFRHSSNGVDRFNHGNILTREFIRKFYFSSEIFDRFLSIFNRLHLPSPSLLCSFQKRVVIESERATSSCRFYEKPN